jgi:hypothetical protein
MQLVFILFLIGHVIASMFFPPLRRRLRRRAERQGKALVRATVDGFASGLREHVEAVDQLARDGRDLLRSIDRTVASLTAPRTTAAGVDRLFGQPAPQPAAVTAIPDAVEPVRRRPRFD